MNKATIRRAVTKHGVQTCREAFVLNEKQGEGPSNIACMLGLAGVAQANACINAGREIDKVVAEVVSFLDHAAVSKSDVAFRTCIAAATRRVKDIESCGVNGLVFALNDIAQATTREVA